MSEEKKTTPFDFANAIMREGPTTELRVNSETESGYVSYLINRSLSFGYDTVIAANEMNSRPHLEKAMQYDFLRHTIAPKKRFNKWIKRPELSNEISIIMEYFGYNERQAIEAKKLLSESDISKITKKTRKGGE
jgi:hypothetical protein